MLALRHCGNSPGPAPIPGLDRCNDADIMNSPTVAIDPADPNHVFVAWATATSAQNEDILVADSTDGGLTFPRSVRMNAAVTARRFMPWACSLGGSVFVSWYDRRAATPANNDLTSYFLARGFVVGRNLQVDSETNLSGNADPECATGWPCSTFETKDATSCSVQPQLAGFCSTSGARCDFAAPNCPVPGEMCNGGSGCPKYGDYNGNACAAGQMYAAWASATSPPGLPPVGGISIFASVFPSPPCASGLTRCSASCVNLNNDRSNCGACGNSCAAGQGCVNGLCQCPEGTRLCCGGDLRCRRQCPVCP